MYEFGQGTDPSAVPRLETNGREGQKNTHRHDPRSAPPRPGVDASSTLATCQFYATRKRDEPQKFSPQAAGAAIPPYTPELLGRKDFDAEVV